MSLHGRRFAPQNFPSPFNTPGYFSSSSICLIDLDIAFIVLTQGNPEPHQNGLFRLQVDRSQITFADQTSLGKDECQQLLEELLEKFTACDIVGVDFPFFGPGELNLVKYRPCVVLYGDGVGPLYLAVYVGTPKEKHKNKRDWEIRLSAPEDIAPDFAALNILDVSKLCCLPEVANFPGLSVHGRQTWDRFFVNEGQQRSALAQVHPSNLRQTVISTLVIMLQNNPYISSYFDSTIEYDEGSWVQCRKLVDGEWCTMRIQYKKVPAC
jgi:hypothetical protein